MNTPQNLEAGSRASCVFHTKMYKMFRLSIAAWSLIFHPCIFWWCRQFQSRIFSRPVFSSTVDDDDNDAFPKVYTRPTISPYSKILSVFADNARVIYYPRSVGGMIRLVYVTLCVCVSVTAVCPHSSIQKNKKAVQSHRWPRDATTKVNKQPAATPPPKIT